MIGVEIDEGLAGAARRNLERARFQLRPQAEEVTASAAGWAIPDDTSAVFNPFNGQTFRAAAGQTFGSHDRRPQILRILYYCPWGARLAPVDRPGGRRGREARMSGVNGI